jgi:FAD:protein FMN transferase
MRFAEPVAALICAAVAAASPGPVAVHSQRYAMGTMFEVLAYHHSRALGEAAVARALDEVERLDSVLSHFKTDSDLTKLVRRGRSGYVAVDRDLYQVLSDALEMSRLSDGNFDVTVGRLLKAWHTARGSGASPSAEALAAAQRCVGYAHIHMRPPDQVSLDSDCLALDLGGIGKGYAVERAIAVLREHGMTDAVVNAGRSSIAAIGHPPARTGWPVNLYGEGAALEEIELRDVSLSTSEQRSLHGAAPIFDAIVSPGTGLPTQTTVKVVVLSPRATTADALSTTLLLTSIERGRRIVDHYPGSRAWWIANGHEVVATHAAAAPGRD